MTPPVPVRRTRKSALQKARASASTSVVGYLRCSTHDQDLNAQRAAITAACEAKGWTVAAWCEDEGVSGTVPPADRPGMGHALDLLTSFAAGALVVAKLDRCSRDSQDFAGLLKRAARDGWALVALDLGVDTSTPVGRMVAEMMMAVAQWERARIAERTREALAARKALGQRLGRPVSPASAVARARMRQLLVQGESLGTVAATLNAEGHRTATGLEWTWRHVQKTRDSLALDDHAEAGLRG